MFMCAHRDRRSVLGFFLHCSPLYSLNRFSGCWIWNSLTQLDRRARESQASSYLCLSGCITSPIFEMSTGNQTGVPMFDWLSHLLNLTQLEFYFSDHWLQVQHNLQRSGSLIFFCSSSTGSNEHRPAGFFGVPGGNVKVIDGAKNSHLFLGISASPSTSSWEHHHVFLMVIRNEKTHPMSNFTHK